MHLRLTMALRFMRSRRKGALTRFISFASTSGIALGVFAAIVGFSAMNGFEYELEHRVLSVIPSAQLNSGNIHFKDTATIKKLLDNAQGIVASAPAFEQKAILVANQTFLPVNVVGVDPQAERKVINLEQFSSVNLDMLNPDYVAPDASAEQELQLSVEQSALESEPAANASAQEVEENPFVQHTHVQSPHLSQTKNSVKALSSEQLSKLPEPVREAILASQNAEGAAASVSEHMPRFILGATLARKLGVDVGDTFEMVTLDLAAESDSSKTALDYNTLKHALQTPKKIRAQVVGLVKIGGQLDSLIALTHIECLEDVLGVNGPNTIHIRTQSLTNTKGIVLSAISGKIAEEVYMSTWLVTHGKLYHDIQMVRQIMFLAMFLVLAVACFNIISNLMMMVGEKRREIAILLTMGMTPRNIIVTFSLMGLMSGTYGALIGIILGVPFSLLLTPVTSHFKEWFGFDLLNPDVYFINFIPCRLDWLDLAIIITVALCMSLGAALYPACRAAHVKPAQELNL